MSLVGPHIIGGFDGVRVTKELKFLIQKYQLGGVIFFARNIESPKQLKALTKELQGLSQTRLFFGIDQEGGRVFRLKKPFTQIPPMAELGLAYRKTKNGRAIELIGATMGRELREVGLNWDYAPVVDVHSNPKNPVIGDRSFGPDPNLVAVCAAHLIKGLRRSGVLSCVKHFPGHGATSTDSHKELPVVRATGRLLWKRDISPYKYLLKHRLVDSIMTAHVLFPHWDAEHMATLSKKILSQKLRTRLGYRGVIISDDLHMKAIKNKYGLSEACLKFFQATGDIALICRHPEEQIRTLEALEGETKKSRQLTKLLSQSKKRIHHLRGRLYPLSP